MSIACLAGRPRAFVLCVAETRCELRWDFWLAFWAESHYASIVPEEDLAGAAPL